MKRVTSLLLTSGLLTFFQVNAADNSCMHSDNICTERSGWFVGGHLGKAKTDVSLGDISDHINSLGFGTTEVSGDKSDTSHGLFVGYQFDPHWAVQLEYMDLGDRELSLTTTLPSSQIAPFSNSISDVYLDTGSGLRVSGVFFWPLTQEWQVAGKVGLLRWENDFNHQISSMENIEGKESGTDLTLGVELDYEFDPQWQFYLAVDTVKMDHDNVHNFGIGFRHFFGMDKPAKVIVKPAPSVESKPIKPKAPKSKANSKPESKTATIAPKVQAKPVVEQKKVNAVKTPKAEKLKPAVVYFGINKYGLTAEYKSIVAEVIATLKRKQSLNVNLVGFASSIGDYQYNQELSKKRVRYVADMIKAEGINESRINTDFVGDKDQPSEASGQRVEISYIQGR